MQGDFDDVLRCANCGSNDTHVERDYVPGSGTTGKGFCLHCGLLFSFTYELQPELRSAENGKEMQHVQELRR